MPGQYNSFRLDSRRFQAALREAMPTTRKTVDEFLMMQGRGLVKTLIAVTPPSSSPNMSATEARQAGEAAVERDVRKVFEPTRRNGVNRVNLRAEVDRLRNPRSGRVGRVRDKIPARAADINAEIRRRKAGVGRLAAGWVPAAKRFGVTRVPAWVKRHSTPGAARISIGRSRFRLTVTNSARFAGGVRGIHRRVQLALDIQAKAMETGAATYWRKKAARAGFDLT